MKQLRIVFSCKSLYLFRRHSRHLVLNRKSFFEVFECLIRRYKRGELVVVCGCIDEKIEVAFGRALLTGARGGIGSATASGLRESGYEVIGMDRSQGESAADHFLQCDIRAFHADANSVRSQPTPASLRASPHSVVDAAACRSKTPSPRSARSAKASSTC